MERVIKVELLEDYKVFIEFNDGKSGTIDFKEKLTNDHRQIVRELLDLNIFRTVKVDMGTLCWDNGVDFAPEYLYEKLSLENKKVA
jgi:hypothetical protein